MDRDEGCLDADLGGLEARAAPQGGTTLLRIQPTVLPFRRPVLPTHQNYTPSSNRPTHPHNSVPPVTRIVLHARRTVLPTHKLHLTYAQHPLCV
eukprot:1635386-Rhodomonas_salina.2